jgi:hypothetical protein
MTTLQEGSAPGKRIDPAGERELLIHLLRTATARSRLQTNLFETIGVSLRHRQIDCAAALAWLRDEGVIDHIQLGPKVRQ